MRNEIGRQTDVRVVFLSAKVRNDIAERRHPGVAELSVFDDIFPLLLFGCDELLQFLFCPGFPRVNATLVSLEHRRVEFDRLHVV